MSSKKTQSKQASKDSQISEGGIPIPLYVPNVLGYIRLVAIVISWPFGLSDPYTFLVLYGTC